jgi:hypothetical protein
MTRKHLTASPVNVLKLFVLVIGGIILLAMIFIIGLVEWPLVSALTWHLRYGSSISFEGHAFQVPWAYNVEASKKGDQLDLIDHPGLLGGIGSITLTKTGKILEANAAEQWQSSLINAVQSHPDHINHWSTETLHGRKLTFVCVDDMSQLDESLVCHAIGIDLTASTMASPNHIKETRAILETSN